jgi:putative mycofactocin binding protein MftB
MCSESVYRLWDGVQVREEKFGLLFYDYRGPKLHFLPSKDFIRETFFFGQNTAGELVDSICEQHGGSREPVRRQVSKILEMLRSKGLIYEQPVR